MICKDTISTKGVAKEWTPEGYLLVKSVRIARTGVHEYAAGELFMDDGRPLFPTRDPSDIVLVNRPEDEVFRGEALRSFDLQPITVGHPIGGVVLTNHPDLSVGVVANPRRENIYVIADLKITNKKAIEELENGTKELSCGYSVTLIAKQGHTTDGVQYEAEQKNIRGNHVALVDLARCGPACSIHDRSKKKETKKMKITIDEVPYTCADESLAAAINNITAKNLALAEQITSAQSAHDAAVDTLTKTHDEAIQQLQAKLDQSQANEITPEKLDAILADRLAVITQVQKIIPDFSHTGKTSSEIKSAVLEKIYGDKISKEKMTSEAYIDARFDALVESNVSAPTGTENLIASSAQKTAPNVGDSASSNLARDRKLVGDRLAYKFPVGARKSDSIHYTAFSKAVDDELKKIQAL